jgi:chromosome segregation ATPase
MQVFNAKRSTVTIPLDNGEIIQVHPGQCSRPFVGTAAILMSVINSGAPNEIGVIVSSSYELDLIRQVSASMEYLFQSESDARAKLMEGKDLTPKVSDNPYAVEMQKFQEKYDNLKRDYTTLEDQYNKLVTSKDSNDEITRLKRELSAANEDAAQLRNTISTLNAEKDELVFTITDKDKLIASGQENINTLSAQVADLQSKLDAELNKDELDPEQVAEGTLLVKGLKVKIQDLEDELARAAESSAEPLSAEDKAKLEAYPTLVAKVTSLNDENSSLNAEISSMKSDASSLYEKYNAAKSTVMQLMDKFGISYVDGEYVMTASPAKNSAE